MAEPSGSVTVPIDVEMRSTLQELATVSGDGMVNQIAVLTCKRSAPGLIGLPEHDRRHALWNPVSGEFEYFDKQPPPRSLAVKDVISFERAVLKYGAATATVHINESGIVATIDDRPGDLRRDAIRMPLTETFQFQAATKIYGAKPAALDRVFAALADGVFSDELRSLFSKFRFKSAAEIAGERSVGRESMSKSAQSEAMFKDAPPPSEIVASVFVFKQFSDLCTGPADMGFDPEVFRQKIRMRVDIDFENGTISLPPMEGEVDKAVLNTLAIIRKHLDQRLEDIDVLIGHPS